MNNEKQKVCLCSLKEPAECEYKLKVTNLYSIDSKEFIVFKFCNRNIFIKNISNDTKKKYNLDIPHCKYVRKGFLFFEEINE